MVPLSASSTAVPAAAVRTDGAALITLARFLPRLLHNGGSVDAVKALLRPYSEYVDGKVTHPFLLRWMDLLCFLLSGAPASGTVAAEIGYMFADWYRPGASLEYPVGGSGAIVAALLRGFAKFGGQLRLNAHVSNILVEEGRACGVRLRDGTTVRAQTVISNASIWDTLPMLPSDALPPAWRDAEANTEHCPSFMHLHLGIDAQGLDLPEVHHISVESWHQGVTSPQNLVLVSVPSVLDPALAPQGCHVIHAYTPATEPWALWEHLQPGSETYDALKRERSEVLWRAVEKAVPGVRARVRVQMVGTPKTHARFLRRSQGSYGGTGWLNPEAGGAGGTPAVPTPETPLPGLLCVGDSRFPGPGVPAVAASGMAAAHSLVPFWQQCALLDECVP
jgi:phytoene dehydrogenase-like protein